MFCWIGWLSIQLSLFRLINKGMWQIRTSRLSLILTAHNNPDKVKKIDTNILHIRDLITSYHSKRYTSSNMSCMLNRIDAHGLQCHYEVITSKTNQKCTCHFGVVGHAHPTDVVVGHCRHLSSTSSSMTENNAFMKFSS